MLMRSSLLCCLLLTVTWACAQEAKLPFSAGVGPDPVLPPPPKSLIPTVHVARAKGWPSGGKPSAAPGLAVTAFADVLAHPRWVFVIPNGDVLVAETNAPPKPEDRKGIKGWVMKKEMEKAGAGGSSANRLTLLRDSDGDGRAEFRTVFLEELNSPFGMELVGNDFYVANTDEVMRFPYREGQTRITERGVKITDLPAGPINHHWTRNIIAGPGGNELYITVGSNSNVGENGLDNEQGRAAIWQLDLKTGDKRIFASGLRNPNGMAWEPGSGALWTVVNERDELGSDLVPDFLTTVRDGGFYGWPDSYFGQHVDPRVKSPRPDLVAKAIVPDYALGNHTACLGLTSSQGADLTGRFAEGMFVGQHGSWNREPPSGYKVIFVPFHHGKPQGSPIEVLTGFLSEQGEALGRPVGVAIDRRGALLVADDVGNMIWRVAREQQ